MSNIIINSSSNLLNEITKNYKNEFDTFRFGIPTNECGYTDDLPSKSKILGAQYCVDNDNCIFTTSCKLFATADSLGIYNLDELANKLNNAFGFSINADYLYEKTPIYRADVKKDLFMNEKASVYVCDIWRILKRNSSKYNAYLFKGITYENGLSIFEKNANSSLKGLIYSKGAEIKLPRNKEYRAILGNKILRDVDYILRLEYQMTSFQEIRNAFFIDKSQIPTFKSILNCKADVVANKFCILFDYEDLSDEK